MMKNIKHSIFITLCLSSCYLAEVSDPRVDLMKNRLHNFHLRIDEYRNSRLFFSACVESNSLVSYLKANCPQFEEGYTPICSEYKSRVFYSCSSYKDEVKE